MGLGFISPFYHTVGEWVGLRSVLVLVCLELSLDGTSMVYGDGVVWGSVKGGMGEEEEEYGTVRCCAVLPPRKREEDFGGFGFWRWWWEVYRIVHAWLGAGGRGCYHIQCCFGWLVDWLIGGGLEVTFHGMVWYHTCSCNILYRYYILLLVALPTHLITMIL